MITIWRKIVITLPLRKLKIDLLQKEMTREMSVTAKVQISDILNFLNSYPEVW